MEKHTQDNSSTDNKSVTGQDPDRYEQGYGSFNEKDFEKKPETNLSQEDINKSAAEELDKANIKTGLNEDKSTVSETSAPSESMSENGK